jgi:hypothetical protein
MGNVGLAVSTLTVQVGSLAAVSEEATNNPQNAKIASKGFIGYTLWRRTISALAIYDVSDNL